MKKIWKYLKVIITLGVLGYFVYYFFNHKSDLQTVFQTPLKYLILIFLLASVSFFINGIFIKVTLKSFKKVISVLESFYVSVMSSLGNYFLPLHGGTVIRSVYLKKRFDFPYTHFVSTLYGYYIVLFLVNSFMGLISLLVITLKYGVSSLPLYLFFGLLFVGMLILTFLKIPAKKNNKSKFKFLDKVLEIIRKVSEGWNMIVEDKGLLLSLIGISVVFFISTGFLYYFEFRGLGIDVSIMNVILYNCLSGVSLLVSITPGSLGIREGIFSITSDILGISNEQIMQLALLDRGVIVIVLVVLFVVLWVGREINKLLRGKADEKEM
ncbi:flippase-like domain-containing protein [Candidatus Dojkabacteria bacterium]|nr:flippase-like domain-containing protein [Candidatus Dojkabacteria bacterium]